MGIWHCCMLSEMQHHCKSLNYCWTSIPVLFTRCLLTATIPCMLHYNTERRIASLKSLLIYSPKVQYRMQVHNHVLCYHLYTLDACSLSRFLMFYLYLYLCFSAACKVTNEDEDLPLHLAFQNNAAIPTIQLLVASYPEGKTLTLTT